MELVSFQPHILEHGQVPKLGWECSSQLVVADMVHAQHLKVSDQRTDGTRHVAVVDFQAIQEGHVIELGREASLQTSVVCTEVLKLIQLAVLSWNGASNLCAMDPELA